jgi:hypothetical protein
VEKVRKNVLHFLGILIFYITSWMSLPAYNADFGIGFASPHDRGLILLSTDRDDYVILCCVYAF